MYALAIVALLLVTLSLANSPIVERESSSLCAMYDRANFTLLAIDSDHGNQSSLGLVEEQNSPGFAALQITDSVTTVLSTNFAMSGGGMSATSSGQTVGYSYFVQSGSYIEFLLPGSLNVVGGKGSVSRTFCIKKTIHLFKPDTHTLSIIDGDSTFSLCPFISGNGYVVVYIPSNSSSGYLAEGKYDVEGCKNITIAVL